MAYNKSGPIHRGEKGTYLWGRWYPDLELLPDDQREMPPTIPLDEIGGHKYGCRCVPCSMYPAEDIRKARSAARKQPRSPSPSGLHPPADAAAG